MTAIQTFDTESILALRERWEPIPKRPGYALGMGALLIAVIIMPLAYLAAVGAIGYGVYWQLVENAPAATASAGPGRRGIAPLLWFALWLTPALIGIILVVFLLKPFFAPRARHAHPYVLTETEEPRLFAFVHAVCQVIGAPPPRQIAVDCDINASAGFRGGWLSLFQRGDLTLTIGMPLVAGMTKREFAGVLAHEFGHFAQGSGMRITFAAQTIAHWFARAAWERDAWDDALEQISRSGSIINIIPAMAVRLCVWIARLILRIVVFACMGLCAFVLRQMEYDADRYEVQLVGAGAFARVMQRLVDLQVAYPRADDRAAQMWRRDSRVPDNFAALVADAAARITPEARAELQRRIAGDEGGLAAIFSTHPGWDARRARAQTLGHDGLFTDERPARELFSDFNSACLKASFDHYKVRLGRYFDDVTFVPTAPLLSGNTWAGPADRVAADVPRVAAAPGRNPSPDAPTDPRTIIPRYVGFEPPTWRPLFPEFAAVPDVEDGKRLMEKLKRARAALQKLAPSAAAQADAYRSATEEILRWESARFLFDNNLKVDFKKLGLKSTSRAGVSQRIDDLREKAASAALVFDEALEAARDRLRAALCFLGMRGIERLIPDARTRRARADELLAMLSALERTIRYAREVREQLGRIEGMSYAVKNKSTFDQAKKAIRPVSDQIRDRLDDARREAGAVIYPFPSDVAEQSLGARLVGASPGWREYDQIMEAADRLANAWPDEYQRAAAELIAIAVAVEEALARAAKARASS